MKTPSYTKWFSYQPGKEAAGRVVYTPVTKSTTPSSFFGRCAIAFQGKPSMHIEILIDRKLITPYDIVLKHEHDHARIIKNAWNKFAKEANKIKEDTGLFCCTCINASKKYLNALRNVYEAKVEYKNAKLEEKDHSTTPHNVPDAKNKYDEAVRNKKEEKLKYEKSCKQ